jgi:hypothetical protein
VWPEGPRDAMLPGQLDLFVLANGRMLTPEQRKQLQRRGKGKGSRGHAGIVGNGPKGETCGSCAHLDGNGRSRRRFYKCGLVKWTNGPATDIRKRDPACSRWERR